MSSGPVTIAIAGLGSRGTTVYGQYALDHPDEARVVAVADPIQERREAAATAHSVPPELVFADWQEMADRPQLAQAAVIATDDNDHYEAALKFLGLGYSMLLEKPMSSKLNECEAIAAAAERASGLSAVAHVLRYTAFYRRLKWLIREGAVGRILTVRHLEPVNYWHFAHSFVRGNWRNSEGKSPFILAKCCHDLDIILYLMEERPVAVSSFGALSYFRTESAPPDTSERCPTCSLKESCTYSAHKFYGSLLEEEQHGWPLDVVTRDFTPEGLEGALLSGPYGRCVYRCDNNVPDHQTVNVAFESGATASMVATAFTQKPARETEVMGSDGYLKGDGETILHQDFRTGRERLYRIEGGGGHHMGGDGAMLEEFFRAVAGNDRSLLSSTPQESLLSHKMAILAERSRLHGTVEAV